MYDHVFILWKKVFNFLETTCYLKIKTPDNPIGYVQESKRRLPTLSRASLVQQATPTPEPR